MAERVSHSEPHPDVAGFLLGTLEAAEAADFMSHLDGCDACRRELDQLADLPGLLVDVPDSFPLPAALEERTFLAIEAEAAAAVAGSVAGSVVAGSVVAAPVVAASVVAAPGAIVPITAARRRRRPALIAAAVAAAAAIVVAAGLATVAALRTSTPPTLATVRLVAVNGGPAHGIARIRAVPAGITVDMTVDGLPPAPEGKMYTCWLVADDDTLAHPDRVSVGTFVVRGATVVVHWTSAADLARFPHLGITVEPDNGNPSHQGPKVLTSA